MAYQNPEAGKILGYVYENAPQPERTINGGQLTTINRGGDDQQTMWLPGTKPDGYTEEGRAYKFADSESAPTIMTPEQYKSFSSISVNKGPGAKEIPLYQPFFTPSWKGRPMTKEELFSSAAIMAGANDAPIKVSGLSQGTAQSHMFNDEVRKGLGLPNSFDMFQGVDPTKPDWGASKWRVFNPKSSSFFEDLTSFGTALLTETPLLQFLSGGVPIGAEAGANIAANMVAQEAAQQAMEQAVSNALAGTATQAATAAATTAVAEGGLGSLINSVKDLGSTISKEVSDSLGKLGIKGISEDAVQKAGVSAAKAALTGGNPLEAALSSAVTTGVVDSTKDLLSTIDPSIAKTVTSAVQGATQAALKGTDVGLGALTGAATTGVSEAVKGSELLKGVDPELKNVINSVANSVTGAALTGGDLASAVSQGVLSGAMTPTAKPAQPSPAQPAAPVDADELINQMIRAQEPITPMEQLIDYVPEVTPVEPPPDLRAVELPSEAETFPVLSPEQPLSQQDLTDQLVETFPVAPPEEITEAPASLDDIISQLQEQAQQQQTLEQVLAGPQETVTPTEDWIDQGRLISSPLQIEIAGTGQPAPIDYATPTEEAIDTGALGGSPYMSISAPYATPTEDWIDLGRLVSSPLQIEIAGYGQEAPYEYATPTEDWIDTGGLGGAPYEYSTPTEDWIDRGGLGGAPTETPIGIGATGPGGGSTTGGGTGGGTKQPTGPSATDQLLQQLQQQQQQLAAQQQRQSDMSSLMAMLGIMGASQQKAAPPPIPLVGEIKPYQFSTDLLEGIYQTPKMAQGGSINELMRILRG